MREMKRKENRTWNHRMEDKCYKDINEGSLVRRNKERVHVGNRV